MQPRTVPTTEIGGKTVKDFELAAGDFVIVFTDGTWCHLRADYGFEYLSLVDNPEDEPLNMQPEALHRMGLIPDEDYASALKSQKVRDEWEVANAKSQRYQEYLELKKEFEEEDS